MPNKINTSKRDDWNQLKVYEFFFFNVVTGCYSRPQSKMCNNKFKSIITHKLYFVLYILWVW